MTKKQKLDALRRDGALPGETLFMPILMHFAARHGECSYADFAADHRARVAANLRCLEDFDLDVVTLMSDPYAETSAFGARIEYLPEAVPRCLDLLVRTAGDVRSLGRPDLSRAPRIQDRLRGAELFQRELKGTVPVVGWVEGPLAEACDLAGMTGMFEMLMLDPGASERLLDLVLETAKEFATLQIEAGCDIIGIGDAACSQIDPVTYETFILERHRDLVSHIQSQGAIVKFHICGDISHLLPAMASLQLDLVDLDSPVDITHARAVLGPAPVITGNLDPTLILDRDAGAVEEMALGLVRAHAGTRYVLAGGCEIGVNTPRENLHAMRRAARGRPA